MMSNITGRVDRISTKTGNGKRGTWTLYSMQVNGEWYSLGFDAPPCSEGDTIAFVVGQNDRGYATAEGITVGAAAPATPTTAIGAPVNTRQVSIEWQSSHKDALAVLPVLFEQGAIKFPTKPSIEDKYDAIVALVDVLTVQNFVRLQEVTGAGGVDVEDFIPAPGE